MNINVKRAGFRWGIGRELYTSPVIFLRVPTKANGKGGFALEDSFASFDVKSIEYSDKNISELTIQDNKGNVVFTFGKKQTAAPAKQAASAKPATITAVVEPAADGSVTPEQLDKLICSCCNGKSDDEKRAVSAIVKKINGSVNYRSIEDPEMIRKVYEAVLEHSKQSA